jgi:rubrerythrin
MPNYYSFGSMPHPKVLPSQLHISCEVNRMLSTIPIDLNEIDKGNIDKEILRAGIIAELDAINLYEQMAALTKNEAIRASLIDIGKEEKTHVGEFQALLLQLDQEQADELEHGKREVEQMAGK